MNIQFFLSYPLDARIVDKVTVGVEFFLDCLVCQPGLVKCGLDKQYRSHFSGDQDDYLSLLGNNANFSVPLVLP